MTNLALSFREEKRKRRKINLCMNHFSPLLPPEVPFFSNSFLPSFLSSPPIFLSPSLSPSLSLIFFSNLPPILYPPINPPFSEGGREGGASRDYGTFCCDAPTVVDLKVEPKTFFANERTFIQWASFCVVIQTIGVAFVGFVVFGQGKGEGRMEREFLIFCFVFVLFSFFFFFSHFFFSSFLFFFSSFLLFFFSSFLLFFLSFFSFSNHRLSSPTDGRSGVARVGGELYLIIGELFH